MTLVRLLKSDETWERFQHDWERQCEEIRDSFGHYAQDALPPIKLLAEFPDHKEWALTIQQEGRHMAAFIAILANQKGFDGPVLRIRHIVACPLLDNGVLSADTYADTLISLLFEAIKLSETKLVAKYIKMHVRSPADLEYFRALGPALDKQGVFESTELQGAWLTLTKA